MKKKKSKLFETIFSSVKNSDIFEYISALFQGSEYYAIPPDDQEHWDPIAWNKMHIKQTSPTYVDITIDLYHNRYVHFYNEEHLTAAQVYEWDHIHVRIPKHIKRIRIEQNLV